MRTGATKSLKGTFDATITTDPNSPTAREKPKAVPVKRDGNNAGKIT
mgnify:CR=1 FL=1